MNIKNVLSLILVKYSNDNTISNKVLEEIQDSIIEMEAAESMFNSVNDPKLIEAAIYREEAAKRKFDYLLSVAKEQYSREQEKENEEMEKEIFDIKHEMLTMQSELDKANGQIKKLAEERQAAKDQVIRLETELGRNKHR